MSVTENRIFISTVSDEFDKPAAPFPGLRGRLRRYLTAADCEVKVQEDFRQTHGGTVDKLDDYVRRCAAVIHLVGEMSGTIADANDVAAYLRAIESGSGGRKFRWVAPVAIFDGYRGGIARGSWSITIILSRSSTANRATRVGRKQL